jgi:hypothetical protein
MNQANTHSLQAAFYFLYSSRSLFPMPLGFVRRIRLLHLAACHTEPERRCPSTICISPDPQRIFAERYGDQWAILCVMDLGVEPRWFRQHICRQCRLSEDDPYALRQNCNFRGGSHYRRGPIHIVGQWSSHWSIRDCPRRVEVSAATESSIEFVGERILCAGREHLRLC